MHKLLPVVICREFPAFIAVLSCFALLGLLARGAHSDTLSLDSCVTRALQAHPALRAADRDIEAARARLSQAGSFDAPDLSFAVGKRGTPVSAGDPAPEFTLEDQDGRGTSLSAEWKTRPVVLIFYRGNW